MDSRPPTFPVPPTDEQLSACLDGELQGSARQALRVRLSPWLDEPVPPALAAAVQRGGPGGASLRRPVVLPRWAMAAAAAGLLLLGGVLGGVGVWQWQPARGTALANGGANGGVAAGALPVGWVQRAAAAHAVYVPEPRHAVEVKAQEEHLARWLTRRIDVPVKLFDLREQGFELVGGRLLPDGAGKSAQLMYQDAQGLRVTVYLRKPEVGTPAAFRYERQGDLGLFYWVESGAGYALVGNLPRAQLLALAEAIYRQGGGKAPG